MIFSRPGEAAEHSQTEASEDPVSTVADSQSPQEQTEKRIRGLKKKLQQIEKLKSKQDEGEVLEDLQVIARFSCLFLTYKEPDWLILRVGHI